jgi:hypothetical protein
LQEPGDINLPSAGDLETNGVSEIEVQGEAPDFVLKFDEELLQPRYYEGVLVSPSE